MGALTIKVNEIFFSIQGESSLAGKPTVFIRTAACNLRCRWCDTRYAFWEGKLLSTDEILIEVKKHRTKYVCVTGGEPLGQKGSIELMQRLLAEGYVVSLETGGGFSILPVPYDVVKIIDVKCPDSGETENMAWENLELARPHDEFKFVINSKSDFDWANSLVKKHKLDEKCEVLFSPVHGVVKPAQLAKWILDSEADVTLQTQLHKDLWGAEERGV